jgi:cytidyltransferase-like protein
MMQTSHSPTGDPLTAGTAAPVAGTRGLCIGKFWPYHRGHHHLLQTAQDGCDHLYVIVCHRPFEQVTVTGASLMPHATGQDGTTNRLICPIPAIDGSSRVAPAVWCAKAADTQKEENSSSLETV